MEAILDHEPVIMKLCLESKYVSLANIIYSDRIAWYKANDSHLMEYRNVLDVALKNILVPVNTVACRDSLCDNYQHSADLNACMQIP